MSCRRRSAPPLLPPCGQGREPTVGTTIGNRRGQKPGVGLGQWTAKDLPGQEVVGNQSDLVQNPLGQCGARKAGDLDPALALR